MLVVLLPGDFRADQKINGPMRTSIVDGSDGGFHCSRYLVVVFWVS